jgi:hypothetical protein
MRLCFQVNLVGTLRVTKACLPLLKSCAGRVLMVSSVAGVHAYPGLSVYCATKHAIEGLAQVGLKRAVSVILTFNNIELKSCFIFAPSSILHGKCSFHKIYPGISNILYAIAAEFG